MLLPHQQKKTSSTNKKETIDLLFGVCFPMLEFRAN